MIGKINEIRFMARYNKGNYEHEELSISAVPQDGTDLNDAVYELKSKVLSYLDPKFVAVNPTVGNVVEVANPTAAPTASAPAATPAEAPKRGRGRPVVNKEAEAPTKIDVQQTTAQTDSTPASSPPPTPKSSKKTIKYNRTVDFQKDALASKLSELFPGWMEDEAKVTKAKAASEKMQGKDFMDSAEGVIFPEFMEEFLKVAGLEQSKKSPL